MIVPDAAQPSDTKRPLTVEVNPDGAAGAVVHGLMKELLSQAVIDTRFPRNGNGVTHRRLWNGTALPD